MDVTQLSECIHWSIENKCCRLIYNNSSAPKYSNFKMDVNDYDKNCNGKSNASLCIAYCYPSNFVAKTEPRKKISVMEKKLL